MTSSSKSMSDLCDSIFANNIKTQKRDFKKICAAFKVMEEMCSLMKPVVESCSCQAHIKLVHEKLIQLTHKLDAQHQQVAKISPDANNVDLLSKLVTTSGITASQPYLTSCSIPSDQLDFNLDCPLCGKKFTKRWNCKVHINSVHRINQSLWSENRVKKEYKNKSHKRLKTQSETGFGKANLKNNQMSMQMKKESNNKASQHVANHIVLHQSDQLDQLGQDMNGVQNVPINTQTCIPNAPSVQSYPNLDKECPICGRVFYKRWNCKMHMKDVHKIEIVNVRPVEMLINGEANQTS